MFEAIALILFAVFAYMKISETGKIAEWSWWKVTSPLWIYAIGAIVIYGIVLGGVVGFMSISNMPMTIQ